MNFNQYTQFGNEINKDGIGLALLNVSRCKTYGWNVFTGLPTSLTKCGSFTGNCREAVNEISKIGQVLTIRKSGSTLIALVKLTDVIYKTDETARDCSPNKQIGIGSNYVLFEREENTFWRFKNKLNDLYVCYNSNGNVDCEALANGALPRGTYYRKDAITGVVEVIKIGGLPAPIQGGSLSGKRTSDETNEYLLNEFKNKINDNKGTIVLVVVIVIMIVLILALKK